MTLRRTIHPKVNILDEDRGIVEYVASDQSLDADREIVMAKGWRFDRFRKNAPFVDSHDYSSVEKLLGQVIDYGVEGDRLIETVQWAVGVPENRLAQIGWKMTYAGFLKAVSVGFIPTRTVTRNDQSFKSICANLKVPTDSVKVIFAEQQQLELSSVLIGSNPNALAKAYKADVLSPDDVEFIALGWNDEARAIKLLDDITGDAGDAFGWLSEHAYDNADECEQKSAQQFLDKLEQIISRL